MRLVRYRKNAFVGNGIKGKTANDRSIKKGELKGVTLRDFNYET